MNRLFSFTAISLRGTVWSLPPSTAKSPTSDSRGSSTLCDNPLLPPLLLLPLLPQTSLFSHLLPVNSPSRRCRRSIALPTLLMYFYFRFLVSRYSFSPLLPKVLLLFFTKFSFRILISLTFFPNLDCNKFSIPKSPPFQVCDYGLGIRILSNLPFGKFNFCKTKYVS